MAKESKHTWVLNVFDAARRKQIGYVKPHTRADSLSLPQEQFILTQRSQSGFNEQEGFRRRSKTSDGVKGN